ncbi:MAG: 1-acyl-sn-glycerol-3-phosphate acyltransferase [Deltaproteobacteria bacterium]|nr:1-acyl-sn-glycerol-3-phosphate acyltransferase [Deltaproteobacteria bacterium]
MSHAAPLSRPFPARPAPAAEVVGPPTLVRGPLGLVESTLRLSLGLAWVCLCSLMFAVALFVLLPSRVARIKVGNVYGSFIGKGCAWLTGSRYTIKGREHADPARPAIYVANHASLVDIFLGAWLSPTGTCGVAKKEIIFYPFFGQFFWLAGHLRLDRGNHGRAVASLRELAALVKRHALSIFIWPEGTRSKDGRLRPFKKGAFHVALATGLPIVPMVIAGSHRAWETRSLRLARTEVEVTFLPPIDTTGWRRETLDEHIAEVERVMAAALPYDQRPAPTAVAPVARAA